MFNLGTRGVPVVTFVLRKRCFCNGFSPSKRIQLRIMKFLLMNILESGLGNVFILTSHYSKQRSFVILLSLSGE